MDRARVFAMLREALPGAEQRFLLDFFDREDTDRDGFLRAADLARAVRPAAAGKEDADASSRMMPLYEEAVPRRGASARRGLSARSTG